MFDTEYVSNIVNSFLYYDMIKMNLIYDSTFWIDYNLKDMMPSGTDLEIFEFFIEDAWTNGTLTALHFYIHGKAIRFWYSAQLIGDKYPIDDNLKIDNLETLTVASTVVVEQCIKKMKELTNINDIPLPLAAFINFWARDAETQGTTSARNGINIDKIIEKSFKPNIEEDVFIAASDFSASWGDWMENSLQSTINNLAKNFNITNPLQTQTICPVPQI